MDEEARRIRRKAKDARYAASEKGKAARRRRDTSEKGRAASARYDATRSPRHLPTPIRTYCSGCGVVYDAPRKRAYCGPCTRIRCARQRRAAGIPKRRVGKDPAVQTRYGTSEKGRTTKRVACVRRRALLKGAPGAYTTADWIVLCWASGWRCLYCGIPVTEKTVVQEHRVPLVRDGSNDIANIAVSCATCNLRKGTKTDVEFMALIASRPGTPTP